MLRFLFLKISTIKNKSIIRYNLSLSCLSGQVDLYLIFSVGDDHSLNFGTNLSNFFKISAD